MDSVLRRSFLLLLLGLVLIPQLSCLPDSAAPQSTLEAVRERGRLVMITQNSGNTYYLDHERPMGFEYELARLFASHLGVDLEVITPSWSRMFEYLERGEGDFIAAGLTMTPSRQARVDFSIPYFTVTQRLVVHEGRTDIRKVGDLSGLTIHVRAGTSYHERLVELQSEGVDLDLVLVPDVPTEELIRQVADGEIDATVADSNIASLNRRYYPGIRIAFPVSVKQFLAWAVRKGDGSLLEAVNEFLAAIDSDGTLDRIRRRYFEGRDILGKVDLKAFHVKIETHLPRYEGMIREASSEHGFDWRLIAAMVYQESHFNPRARSHTGVRGLMQVTLDTAGEMGISDRLDPEQSVRAGVMYLSSLHGRFDDLVNERDRLLLTLASYNVGYGHVRDAQKIAEELGHDPTQWASMRKALPLLRNPEYYRRTKYGYARGTEPVRYVERILTYYDILRKTT
ncbi:MAG: membrane-bound lytic murein transglycosylase MltF [bacterium]|nr:MAG: membrane-bound lytic murein transglycosylase MltF [bacterium]